jgi:predicted metal-dependent HD superfamily phosphohydrolase
MDSIRFEQLWNRNQKTGSSNVAAEVFARLEKHYAEPHRHYHTAAHIEHCLCQVDLISVEHADRDAVELAIWFHDVIYEIGDPANEENSAKWFMQVSLGELKDNIRAQVKRLIMVTQHNLQPENEDEKYMVDIDLSGFGMPWPEFSADSLRVRQEFPEVSDGVFENKHRMFLEMLASRDFFFCTILFRDMYESQAKHNVREKLLRLNG